MHSLFLYGAFQSYDAAGALTDADSVTVNVYVGNSTSPDPVLSAQAASYVKRGTGLYSYGFDIGSYPSGTTFIVEVLADVAGTITDTVNTHRHPGLLPCDIAMIQRAGSGYYQSPCSPCYGSNAPYPGY